MPGHKVSSSDEELAGLAGSMTEMGWYADYMVENGVNALLRADLELARQIIAADLEVNALQRDVEDRAIAIIARRQPTAEDPREVMAAIRIANELERIADLGRNIALRTLAGDSRLIRRNLVDGVEHLAMLGLRQLERVLDSYGQRDVEAARKVWRDDHEVDAAYVALFRELLVCMIDDARNISLCTHLHFCAKNIERMGDHVTTIAETVHYMITGAPLEELEQRNAPARGRG